MGFAFAEGQTIFLFQFLADADIPLQPVAVGDSFAVVVHAVEDEVAMGIGGVVVTDYDILSVLGPKRRAHFSATSPKECGILWRRYLCNVTPQKGL